MRVWFALAFLLIGIAGSSATAAAQSRNGLFLVNGDSQLELTAYAEPRSGRRLQMAKGALDDAPLMTPGRDLRIVCRLPSWKPTGLIVAGHAIFSQDDTESRTIPFASRPLNVFAVEIRSAELEQPAATARLLDSVKASGDNHGYLFIVLFSNGLIRYYPVRLALEK